MMHLIGRRVETAEKASDGGESRSDKGCIKTFWGDLI